jgi:hypothetical protein
MKLKILTSIAGERFSFNRGDVVEWSNEVEAKRWIVAGYAEEVPELKVATQDQGGKGEGAKDERSKEDRSKDESDESRGKKGKPSERADGKGGKGEKATLNH